MYVNLARKIKWKFVLDVVAKAKYLIEKPNKKCDVIIVMGRDLNLIVINVMELELYQRMSKSKSMLRKRLMIKVY